MGLEIPGPTEETADLSTHFQEGSAEMFFYSA